VIEPTFSFATLAVFTVQCCAVRLSYQALPEVLKTVAANILLVQKICSFAMTHKRGLLFRKFARGELRLSIHYIRQIQICKTPFICLMMGF